MILPKVRLGSFLAERYLFNQALRLRRAWNYDAIIGFDLDGFAVARQAVPRIANIKGVLADAVRFESGLTRASLGLHARCEAVHAPHADLVITISVYCRETLHELSTV